MHSTAVLCICLAAFILTHQVHQQILFPWGGTIAPAFHLLPSGHSFLCCCCCSKDRTEARDDMAAHLYHVHQGGWGDAMSIGLVVETHR
jgi:hypothetical protein